MLEILKRVENALLPMLEKPESWNSLLVNYHRPFIERLWLPMKVDDTHVRVNLHRVHPCQAPDALFHPHPWPSAMRVIRGEYEMGMGVAPSLDVETPPEVAARFVGQRGMAYEMTDPRAWHYIRPLGMANVFSLMVSGEPYEREIPNPVPAEKFKNLPELTEDQSKHILTFFKGFYRSREMALDPTND